MSDYSALKDHWFTENNFPEIKQYNFFSCEINHNSVNTKHILTDVRTLTEELLQHLSEQNYINDVFHHLFQI